METKEEYSFWDLISNFCCIEIPAIQRDYAQGRKSESRIATTLIGELHEILTSTEIKKINLHFIYGKTENRHLIPLDGQQRLTTLFLLHWFLSIESLSVNDRNILSRFRYETRPSSEDFCLKLVKEGITYQYDESKNIEDQKISNQIKNSKWFFLSWENDSTISAMLNMLDIIQNKFKKPDENLFKNLLGENCPIKFHFLQLETFKLDDKIYVKMNSRGKPLTEFENFKANFSALLDDENKSKLDNEWLDIFWILEKEEQNVNIDKVDKRYLNFLKNITLNFYVETEDINNTFIYSFNIFDNYEKIYLPKSERLIQLQKTLDSLTQVTSPEECFCNFLKDNPEYSERLQFYAVTQFLIKKGKINESNIKIYHRWIRVCRNLINNTLFQNSEIFYRAVRAIKVLSNNIDNLYEYLAKPESKIEPAFPKKQCEEERIKAMLLQTENKWETEICEIEKHSYFTGQIGFILNYAKKDGEYDINLFADYSTKLAKLFSDDFKDNKNCLFQRALLAFGDYSVETTFPSRTFCTFNTNLREKMDSWRKVFDDINRSLFLKKLLERICTNSIESDLNDIIVKYSENDWKNLFIKNKGIIEYCKKYKIAERQGKFQLSRSDATYWRKHVELYSYVLFKTKLEGKIKGVRYIESSDYDDPYAVIDLNFRKCYFTLRIYFHKNFSLRIFQDYNQITDEIKCIIQNFNFNLEEYNNIWVYNFQGDFLGDFDPIYKMVVEIINELNTLNNL